MNHITHIDAPVTCTHEIADARRARIAYYTCVI